MSPDRFIRRACVAACATAALLSAALPGQSYQEGFSIRAGDSIGLGHSVCVPGDLDGDGRDDIVYGHFHFDTIRAISGLTGRSLFSIEAPDGDVLGWSMAAAGDVDGDGRGDFVVGAPQFRAVGGHGYALVISGRTGIRIHTLPAPDGVVRFAEYVDGAGDFDNDGFDDVVVSSTVSRLPEIFVYSGRTGGLLYRDGRVQDLIGTAGLGDLDGDGFTEVAAMYRDRIEIHSGRQRSRIHLLDLVSGFSEFGISVASADVDGDGRLDVIVGAGGSESSGDHSAVFVYENLTRNELMRIEGAAGARLGFLVRAADANGDGRSEILIGAPASFTESGSVLVKSYDGTPTGRTLATLSGHFDNERFGSAFDVGDFDADGRVDVVVGTPRASEVGPRGGRLTAFRNLFSADAGSVRVIGRGCNDHLARRPALETAGRTVVDGTFEFQLRAAPFGSSGSLLLGFDRALVPLDPFGMPGCIGHVAPVQVLPLTTSMSGSAAVAFTVPNDPSLAGVRLFGQALISDPFANALGMITSNGLRVRLGRG